MPARKGLLAPQNTFLDTIATRFDGTHSNFVLGNAKIASAAQTPKNVYPIVYCSDGFCELTGYSRAQIMQKSCACNFLYGQKTDVQNRESISRALESKQELKLEVILYKSSGTPFWCLLDIVPIQNEKHEVVLFLCSHKDITKQKLHEQQQHQLAQLHARKQQQIADHQQQQHVQQLQQVVGAGGSITGSKSQLDALGNSAHLQTNLVQHLLPHNQQLNDATTIGQSNKWQPPQQQFQQQKLEEADEAELAAIANQNALLSMDEFGLEDSAGENEFDDGDDSEDHDKHTASQYSRRRSRAVLYQLSGHYGYRRSVNMKTKLKLNNRMNIPEYKTTTIEKQRFILSHYGVGKSCWDWLILIVSFYVAIVVPYNATFKDKKQELKSDCKIDSIDILVEVVFVIDVILNFRTTFVNRKGEVVTRPKIICKHYVRGWFLVDACAALPFDLLCSMNIYNRSRLDLNLLKLIRLLRLARLLQKMDRYSQYSYIILTLLMLIFSLLAHWCACIWYVIAMEEIDRNPSEWRLGWIHQLSDKLGYSVVNTTDMASSYVTALYFTTSSLTSVGFGNVSANTNAEKIFSIVIMLIGALMHAVVFGNVTALIRVMYARRSNYQTRLRDLKDFFRLHQLPKELQQRMSDYFQTTWSLNHGIETYEILKDFPEELRGDVSLHLHREVLSLPIFETAPQGFLKSLARHIESKFCCPTEYLIHRGDALSYLYLVCNGSMEVLQDNMVVAILGKGDLVGYDVNALMTPEHTQFGLSKVTSSMLAGPMGLVKSSSDLKALTYCDLKCIHISGLLEVLKLYPEFSDTFHREIMHDLSFNLRESHDEPSEGETDDEGADQMSPPPPPPPSNDGNGGAGGATGGNGGPSNGRRSPPAPNIGHLYRSITAGSGVAATKAAATANDNQIGRYDHDEDEANDADHEHEADDLVEEDQEEEDIEEEEEDEEIAVGGDDDDEDDDNHRRDRRDDDDDGGRGAGAGTDGTRGAAGQNGSSARKISDASTVSAAQQANDPATTTTATATANQRSSNVGNNSTNSSDEFLELRSFEGWPRRQKVLANATVVGQQQSLSDDDDDNEELATNQVNGGSIAALMAVKTSSAASTAAAVAARATRRQRQQMLPDPLEGDGLRRRVCQTQEDSQSAHSYDGLVSSKRRSGLATGHQQMTKNNSDDIMLEAGASCRQRTGRLRPAIGRRASGFGQQQQSSSTLARRPLLSFDLSRNTMAIVDRRRRSAGCIPRPLLAAHMNAAASAGETFSASSTTAQPTTGVGDYRRTVGHSSLLHINEHTTEQSSASPCLAAASRQEKLMKRSVSQVNQRAIANATAATAAAAAGDGLDAVNALPLAPAKSIKQQNAAGARSSRSSRSFHHYELAALPLAGGLNSSYGLRNIDARITTISASVREMKQELRQELEQFRGAMQLLMQMVGDNNNYNRRQQAPLPLALSSQQPRLHASQQLLGPAVGSAVTNKRGPSFVQSTGSLPCTPDTPPHQLAAATRTSAEPLIIGHQFALLATGGCSVAETSMTRPKIVGPAQLTGSPASIDPPLNVTEDDAGQPYALLRSQSATSLSAAESRLQQQQPRGQPEQRLAAGLARGQRPKLAAQNRQSVLQVETAGGAEDNLEQVLSRLANGGGGAFESAGAAPERAQAAEQQQQPVIPSIKPSGQHTQQPRAMATAVTTTPSLASFGGQQVSLQVLVGGDTAAIRPVSQCSPSACLVDSASSVSASAGGIRQSSSGALNSLAVVASLDTASDSGRSSSSVASSSTASGSFPSGQQQQLQRNGTGQTGGSSSSTCSSSSNGGTEQQQQAARQLVIQTTTATERYHKPSVVETPTAMGLAQAQFLEQQATTQLNNNNNTARGGRPAKILLTTAIVSASRQQEKGYTIDISGTSTSEQEVVGTKESSGDSIV